MKKVYFLLVLTCLSAFSFAQTTTFNYTGAIVNYTVPPGVTFINITATGAQGGNSSSFQGGKGAVISGNFTVTPGQLLKILVGQQNLTGGANAGGGGGGSFVWDNASTALPMIAAGGGGGAGYISSAGNGLNASTTTTGVNGAGGYNGAGSAGQGGFTPTSTSGYIYWASGGCGWLSDGNAGYLVSGCQSNGGIRPLAGGTGGTVLGSAASSVRPGGFGGGGGGNARCGIVGGGGGGGYSGGGCGMDNNSQYQPGGGGGSYNGGTSQSNTISSGTGNGVVTITVLCSAVGAIVGSSSVCIGSTTTMTNPTGAVGGTWISSNTSVATIGSASGVLTGLSAGTTTLTYSVSNPCGALATMVVTVNPLPESITGSTVVCTGAGTPLASATTGGLWSTSAPGVVTVGSSSGVATGVTTGPATISYTVAGCSATLPVTVNSNPAAVSGPSTLCPAASVSLTDLTSGGTWSSSNTAFATIGAGSGVVTGVSGGVVTLSYTLSTGCFSTKTMTVNPSAPITGTTGVCAAGVLTTLSNTISGGTWSSSNTGVATIVGSTGALTSVAVGVTTISYTTSAGCVSTTVFGVTGTPNVYTVSGGGNYCPGTSGAVVNVSNSDFGVSYQLMNGITPVGAPISGSGFAISFPPTTTVATLTVVANYGSACATNMSGSATIGLNPLPTAFNVTGGGNYCVGGAGVHVFLSSSTIGVNYQLKLNGTTLVGSPVAGTNAALDFGFQTATGVYTVVATNTTTGCVNNMNSSATIGTNSLPTAFIVTGGGGFCSGGTGVSVGLSFSQINVNYQLLRGGFPVSGGLVAGTGSPITFGAQTVAGTYTVVATNTITGCTNTMASSVTVAVNVMPTVFTMTGGGAYCSGATGVNIGLNGSNVGVNYQLFRGTTTVGGIVAGTGAAIDFGVFGVAGSYTVQATNATTGCSLNMFGSANISINPLPAAYNVTGGGGYCAGGTGVHVGLNGSTVGFTYQLWLSTTLVDAEPGTGSAIDFGFETAAGFYTVVAINNITGCSAPMTGNATVVINPLPVIYNVTGGGAYCAGGTGVHIGLNGTNTGINYQLFNGTTVSGTPVAGTALAIDFGFKTLAGSYTVVATNATTGCTNNMAGSASVTINPLPLTTAVTGGGGYCAGGTGSAIGLAGSVPGISYQLMRGTSLVGTPIVGTGTVLNFGLFTTTGTYTIVGTDNTTTCAATMTGSAIVTINPLPTQYNVTGSGSYCAGGPGVTLGLASSTSGVNYQLMLGTATSGAVVAGTGSGISFGPRTTAGTYTVIATNSVTGCTNSMLGSATVNINALPAAFVVTGGGNYCSGGTGVNVGLSASTPGFTYQLLVASVPTGPTVAGSGAALNFGLQTTAGVYTVRSTNNTTGCSTLMTGSATVGVDPLPNVYFLTGGGNYCFGTPGVNIGVSNSTTGVNYQLYLGTSTVGAPIPGTGAAFNFGLQTATGIYSIQATTVATGCTVNMAGVSSVNINPLPVSHNMTGGGGYCPGGTGVHVGLDGTDLGYSYQLYNGTTPTGTAMPGTGIVMDFGLQTGVGTYTVKSTNTTTGCSSVMAGSEAVFLNPAPTVFNVSGSGNYCPSAPGRHVMTDGSDIGTTYQLYNAFGPAGVTIAGTGMPLDFGNQLAGTYTVMASNTSTTCIISMAGSAVIGVSPVPTAYNVTGAGGYCVGGTGSAIGLSGSDLGVNYQLYFGSFLSGTAIAGTGSSLNFGLKTAPGTYTVVATDATTTCPNNMNGSGVIVINPLPSIFNVTGGGGYCAGGTGVAVGLSGSTSGVNYRLYNGVTPVGAAVAGSGSAITFGLQTAAGTYRVVATNATTGCVSNMTGSAVVAVNALPIAYTVSGGGNYCVGGTGMHVMLSGSNTGVTYQLLLAGLPTGATLTGTGMGLDFGLQTATGSYTIKATNSTTGCVNMMTGAAVIGTNALPNVYSVSSTSSNYCIGGAGVDIALSGSETGVNYQLYHVGTAIGAPMAGTGSVIDFGFNTGAGLYTVVATNATTGCTRNMASSVTVVIDPLPNAFTVIGGGGYCNGTTGVHVGLSGSNLGVKYQLYINSIPSGAPVNGTGASLDFGLQTTNGIYTVIATNPATTCVNTMSGSATVVTNPLPAFYTITGGGNYCAGGTGSTVGLSGSEAGIQYQLMVGSVNVGSPVTGTGSAISFGLQTLTGVYTVVALNSSTTCSRTMLGTVTIGTNPAPTAYAVTGGGNYCPGGTGVHVGLGGSQAGISYQLMKDGLPAGSPMMGSGPAIDFGLQTAAGVYTVVAGNLTTGCTATMTASAIVGLSAQPAVFAVTGGGNYCIGTGGVHVGVNGSTSGVNYQLYNGFTMVGGAISGTGGILDFGTITTPATYTVIATDIASTCTRNMAGSATVASIPSVTPIVNISASGGDTLCSGTFTTFTAMPVNGGTAPAYLWKVNGVVMGTSAAFSYTPANTDIVNLTMTSNAACATPATVTRTSTLTVMPTGTPGVTVVANPGNEVCKGTMVNYSAAPVYGGSTPGFNWIKNGVSVSTLPSFSYTPTDGDDIYCIVSSNYVCRTAASATSSHIMMTVDEPTNPTVTIIANPGLNLASGQAVTFNANVLNGGANPSYKWLVNGVAVPSATTANFVTSTLSNLDVVTCEVTASSACTGLTGTASATVHVSGVGVHNVVLAGSDISLVPNPNKGQFTVKGTLVSNTDQDVNLEVTNMLGQVVYTTVVTARNGELNEKVQLGTIANGMYILNLRSGSETKVFHMVIEQ